MENNDLFNLDLSDLDLSVSELQLLEDHDARALPDLGASVGNWFCCSCSKAPVPN